MTIYKTTIRYENGSGYVAYSHGSSLQIGIKRAMEQAERRIGKATGVTIESHIDSERTLQAKIFEKHLKSSNTGKVIYGHNGFAFQYATHQSHEDLQNLVKYITRMGYSLPQELQNI